MIKIFISYCYDNDDWKERLITQLDVPKGQKLLEYWDGRQNKCGDYWAEEIESRLDWANVAILLISAEFLKSEFIRESELQPILERSRQGKIRVFPLIIKPCLWDVVPGLKDIQVRPKDSTPLSTMDEGEIDKNLALFVDEIIKYKVPEERKPQVPKIPPVPEVSVLPKTAPVQKVINEPEVPKVKGPLNPRLIIIGCILFGCILIGFILYLIINSPFISAGKVIANNHINKWFSFQDPAIGTKLQRGNNVMIHGYYIGQDFHVSRDHIWVLVKLNGNFYLKLESAARIDPSERLHWVSTIRWDNNYDAIVVFKTADQGDDYFRNLLLQKKTFNGVNQTEFPGDCTELGELTVTY